MMAIVLLNPGTVETLKIISTLLSVALIFTFTIILLKLRALSDSPKLIDELHPPKTATGGAYRARWDEILRHMDSAREPEWKFAVIEADKLIDLVLKRAGYPGATMGERLMNIQSGQLQNIEGLWGAHKIRNKLAHNVDYFLRYSEAKQAINNYERVLLELEAV